MVIANMLVLPTKHVSFADQTC